MFRSRIKRDDTFIDEVERDTDELAREADAPAPTTPDGPVLPIPPPPNGTEPAGPDTPDDRSPDKRLDEESGRTSDTEPPPDPVR